MSESVPFQMMLRVLNGQPQAVSNLRGSGEYPAIVGSVSFYRLSSGVVVVVRVSGLQSASASVFLGFHIHSGAQCSGNADDPFADALAHYNPEGTTHPNHAGDLPPLFISHGFAFQAVYTDRFSVDEILGKTVIIHSMPDDFTSQPAGNAGEKIACGEIRSYVSA